MVKDRGSSIKVSKGTYDIIGEIARVRYMKKAKVVEVAVRELANAWGVRVGDD